ncbi:hypothetical protein CYMTET_51228, partial [Cymbomonas tetramitiformis]
SEVSYLDPTVTYTDPTAQEMTRLERPRFMFGDSTTNEAIRSPSRSDKLRVGSRREKHTLALYGKDGAEMSSARSQTRSMNTQNPTACTSRDGISTADMDAMQTSMQAHADNGLDAAVSNAQAKAQQAQAEAQAQEAYLTPHIYIPTI